MISTSNPDRKPRPAGYCGWINCWSAGYSNAIATKPATDDDLLANLWRGVLFGAAERSADLPYAAAPVFEKLRAAFPRAGVAVSVSDDGFGVRLGVVR